MRRALLLGMLLAPVLARAQTPPTPAVGSGTVTFPSEARTANDQYINRQECEAGSISLQWSPVFDTTSGKSFADVASYQLYASDLADDATVNTGVCPQSNGDKVTGVQAGPVQSPITTSLTDPSQIVAFDTAVIASVSGQGACTATGQAIMLCVQARDAANAPIGTARARLTVDTSTPRAPPFVDASFGDEAANVSWGEPEGTPAAEYYEVEASALGTIDTGTHSPARVTARSYRYGGLVNGETYVISVRAFSTADNPSAVTTTVVTAEAVRDFWDEYKAADGQEVGGCSAGAAGPIGLALLAGTLALVRRRK